jgi:hypothetical protein
MGVKFRNFSLEIDDKDDDSDLGLEAWRSRSKTTPTAVEDVEWTGRMEEPWWPRGDWDG